MKAVAQLVTTDMAHDTEDEKVDIYGNGYGIPFNYHKP
jgi:hypothetical protein